MLRPEVRLRPYRRDRASPAMSKVKVSMSRGASDECSRQKFRTKSPRNIKICK